MENLKYKIIKDREQYSEYCTILESLVDSDGNQDEIDLLTLLIEKCDEENIQIDDTEPIELVKYLLEVNELKSKNLSEILNLSKGTVSKILNYKKGLSKESIRKLSAYFKISQQAFNKPYELKHQSDVQQKSLF